MSEYKSNPLVDHSLSFALDIICYCDVLDENKKWVVSNQLLKAGTSIGANVWEAQHAESKADFVHKLKIAAKEAHETEYWLLLCTKSNSYPKHSGLNERLLEIKKLLSKIISTSKASLNQ